MWLSAFAVIGSVALFSGALALPQNGNSTISNVTTVGTSSATTSNSSEDVFERSYYVPRSTLKFLVRDAAHPQPRIEVYRVLVNDAMPYVFKTVFANSGDGPWRDRDQVWTTPDAHIWISQEEDVIGHATNDTATTAALSANSTASTGDASNTRQIITLSQLATVLRGIGEYMDEWKHSKANFRVIDIETTNQIAAGGFGFSFGTAGLPTANLTMTAAGSRVASEEAGTTTNSSLVMSMGTS